MQYVVIEFDFSKGSAALAKETGRCKWVYLFGPD
jgi:hypothetical protein